MDGSFSDPSVPSVYPGSENVRWVDTGADKTQMGWEIHPDGLIDVVEMVHERAPELPIYITENGAAYPDRLTPDGTVEDEERQRSSYRFRRGPGQSQAHADLRKPSATVFIPPDLGKTQ